MRDEIIDWALTKHAKMLLVIPAASKDPWTLHGPEALCIGCTQLFVGEYLSDIPDVLAVMDEDETGGI